MSVIAPVMIAVISLNRNILECKYPRAGGGGGGAAVLIETYWNVNISGSGLAVPCVIVLIETYWNVNIIVLKFVVFAEAVLIETYWNVNF